MPTATAEPIITEGELRVPSWLPPFSLAALELPYRSSLWPPVEAGYLRESREFAWSADGRTLAFRITDLPTGR